MQLRQGGTDEFGHEKFTGVPAARHRGGEGIKKEVRVTVLATSSAVARPPPDRVLATRFGVNAADAAHAGEYGVMVSLRGEDIGRVSLADATRQLKLVPAEPLRRRGGLLRLTTRLRAWLSVPTSNCSITTM